MANEADDFDKNIENLKSTVRKSFARLYAALKARELKTLRQLDAIRKQCQDDKDLKRNCVQNIQICFKNESTLLDNISNYGAIDFEKLSLDSNTFLLEDYVSPHDDHMYLYKTIEELTKDEEKEKLDAIEEAALNEVIRTDDCVCNVKIQSEDVSKKFRNLDSCTSPLKTCDARLNIEKEVVDSPVKEKAVEDEKIDDSEEVKKIDPTDDWLNSIKNQTETEPAQADAMEHSTITCS